MQHWVNELTKFDIRIFSLSDTIGCSNPDNIRYLFSNLIPTLPGVEFGAHLHTQPHNWREKIHAAWESGCRRYDGAIRGYGGCPMAKDDLTGNMATENMVFYFDEVNAGLEIDRSAFGRSMAQALEVFPGK